MKFKASCNVYMTSLIVDVIGRSYPKDQEKSFFVVANRQSSINCIKDKSIATCADVSRLLLMYENLSLTLAKKRGEWECNKSLISENFRVFHLLRHLATT